MRSICLFCVLLCCNFLSLYSQTWHQQVDYQIDVRLDEQAHAVQARERVRYTNHSPDTLQHIFFRLAWQGRQQQAAARHTVFSVQQNGIAISFQVHESKPDAAAAPQSRSQTLLEIVLSRPLLPGESDVYTIAWQADVPIFSGGFGRNSPAGIDYTFTNWYPQACVYDDLGWRLGSPFEADFSGEFGTYKVDITLPQKYTVAATGVLLNANAVGHGYETQGMALQQQLGMANVWKFQAEQVRDFAWAADPEWQHEKKQLREGLELHAFYFKKENLLEALESVLAQYERIAFPYRYPQLSVLQMGELRAELPMLVFAGSSMPQLDPIISWEFQEDLLKSTYLLRQFRYVIGDEAFKKGLAAISSRYRYGRLPVAECIHLFERSAGMELDWMWEQWNNRQPVDYAIGTVKADGAEATNIVLERIGKTILPLVVEVIYTDSTVARHYIPVDLLRAALPKGYKAVQEPEWLSADKKYTLRLPKPAASIKSVEIDPQTLMGDIDRENNRKIF